jgi:hypothetical protein
MLCKKEKEMAADHPPAYWQAVAKGLEAESEKAAVYVTHALSLGIAREAIFRRVLIDETPAPYLVKTGLIRQRSQGGDVSRQCYLLVYDPSDTPFYRMDEFVVVPASIAKIVVEVKSGLQGDDLEQIMNVWKSTRPLGVQTMGFAYEGMTVDTFLQHATRLFGTDTANLPVCVAVHDRNYQGIRPTTFAGDAGLPFFVLRFEAFGPTGTAMSTAYFMQWYYWLLTNRSLDLSHLKDWFNRVPLPADAKYRLMSDGSILPGDMQ